MNEGESIAHQAFSTTYVYRKDVPMNVTVPVFGLTGHFVSWRRFKEHSWTPFSSLCSQWIGFDLLSNCRSLTERVLTLKYWLWACLGLGNYPSGLGQALAGMNQTWVDINTRPVHYSTLYIEGIQLSEGYRYMHEVQIKQTHRRGPCGFITHLPCLT